MSRCQYEAPGSMTIYNDDVTMDHTEQYGIGLVFYKAVGTAIQDVLTADVIVDKARRLGIGTSIDMS